MISYIWNLNVEYIEITRSREVGGMGRCWSKGTQLQIHSHYYHTRGPTHEIMSCPHRHPPQFPMVPHSPFCNWSLRAQGGVGRTKRSAILPAHQSSVPSHCHPPLFPIHHPVIEA